MSRFTFIPHTGNQCPVKHDSYVIYRTQCSPTSNIHTHAPHKAASKSKAEGIINWTDGAINRVIEYAVVPKPKKVIFGDLFTHEDRRKGRAMGYFKKELLDD